LSFAVFYAVSLHNLSANEGLETSWLKKGTFMPLPPTSLDELRWFPRAFFNMFANPLGLPFPQVAGVVFVAGCFALLKKKVSHLLMLILPILFTLLASGLHKYPFGRRLLLFLVPLLLIVIVAGIEFVFEMARPYQMAAGCFVVGALLVRYVSGGAASRVLLSVAILSLVMIAAALLYAMMRGKVYAPALGSILLFLLLFQPVGGATNHMLHPSSGDDLRPVMRYVRDRHEPTDFIYSYHRQRGAFQYYAAKYGFGPDRYVLGSDARQQWREGANEEYLKELDGLRGKGRVWVVFSHVRKAKGRQETEEDYFVHHLDQIGERLDRFKRAGASAYLYRLSD
jgi:hypothetical protein